MSSKMQYKLERAETQEQGRRSIIDDCSNVNDLNVEGNVKRCRENESVVVWWFSGG